jgi:hypothetical protein
MNEWENKIFMADSKAISQNEERKGNNRLEDFGVDGRMLKWILKK